MITSRSTSPTWDLSALETALPKHMLVGSMRYRDFAPIGKGGKAEVFRCRDIYLGRDVAYKVLHKSLASRPLEQQMLAREARITAALGGASVPAVHEVGRDHEGRPFFAMELVEGRSLKQIIDDMRSGDVETRGQLHIEEVLAIVAQVAAALSETHKRGVVHADLKPENIIVGADGEASIVDWGIARILEQARDTLDCQPIEEKWGRQGSAFFMSPEQASRQRFLTPSTDIYSLGVVLYECLTLDVPICGKNAEETMSLVATAKPAPPSTAAPQRGISGSVDRCCLKALEKDPQDRFESMSQFAARLTDLLHDQLINFERDDELSPHSLNFADCVA